MECKPIYLIGPFYASPYSAKTKIFYGRNLIDPLYANENRDKKKSAKVPMAEQLVEGNIIKRLEKWDLQYTLETIFGRNAGENTFSFSLLVNMIA